MRKITQNAVNAFIAGTPFHVKGHYPLKGTEIKVEQNASGLSVTMLLHGHEIAGKLSHEDKLYISLCGWNTTTTRERLSGLIKGLIDHYQNNGKTEGKFYAGVSTCQGTPFFRAWRFNGNNCETFVDFAMDENKIYAVNLCNGSIE